MDIEANGLGLWVILAVMAIVTLATRWGGVFVMGFVPINPGVTRFINAMSGSVLVAVLAPMAVTGDHGARLALLSTAVVMVLTRKPLAAITAGIVAAALLRQL